MQDDANWIEPGTSRTGSPLDLTVREAAVALGNRELSARELTTALLERLGEVDAGPRGLGSFVRVYGDDALARASASDDRRTRGASKHMLDGISVGVKDLISVRGFPLTAGSSITSRYPRGTTARAVTALRRKGGIVLGHTRTWEFGFGSVPEVVPNPWRDDLSPGGSSSGSAAAVAAGIVPAALGTDTGGSLRGPAANCGVSTLKPTHGVLSMDAVVPLAPTFDTLGPLARTLDDCGLLFEVMRSTPDRPRKPQDTYAAADLAGRRVALSPRAADTEFIRDDDICAAVTLTANALQLAGAEIVTPDFPAFEMDGFWEILRAESLDYHRAQGHWPASRNLLSTALRELLAAGDSQSAAAAWKALAQRRARIMQWAEWIGANQVSAILEPTTSVPSPTRRITEDVQVAPNPNLTSFWSYLGLPVVAFPTGFHASGSPIGMSLIGAPGADLDLVSMGACLQSVIGRPGLAKV